ncbi:MAG: DUF1987 domain-containing protein [Bacteroidales bacterium]|nr:DUF1987 domain-containing protein [Bacteroidales bacterium]
MKKLDIKEGKLTPKVTYNPDENILGISGSSLPENVHEFYKPILQWLDEYEAAADKVSKPFKVSMKLAYYNSSSMKYIHEIFASIARIHHKGVKTVIEWHYDKDDDLLKEAGQDLSELIGLKFNYITP